MATGITEHALAGMATGTNLFSLASVSPYPPTKEKKTLRQVSHLVLWVEVLPQTCRVKKIHRVIHINFLTACYNKKSVLNNTNIYKL
jgi:hypothetical protein